ncbi:MAG: acylphosphatase, partial [Gammaproteobacteria bacterium]|nr:acylphosphatase [Gammaproteobacteria bacterium]
MLDLDQPENKTAKAHNLNALQLKIYGVVQAVGMRPHIYRQAVDNNLSGWAKNKGAYVEVFIQGTKENIETFIDNLNNHNIPLAKIDRIHRNSAAVNKRFNKFTILNSENITESNDTLSIKDYSICNKCKNELLEKNNKRHLYPFISCTDCGPRYSILYKYPLDRENSTYNAFTPCPSCSSEYSDTNNRRFHSQNICCEKCGPTLFTEETDSYKKSNNEILEQCISLLHQGKIIALKSISGYKLICDATNFEAIDRLRIRKNRPHNAFAVMFPDSSSLRRL